MVGARTSRRRAQPGRRLVCVKAEDNLEAGGQPVSGAYQSKNFREEAVKESKRMTSVNSDDEFLDVSSASAAAPVNFQFSSPLLRTPLSGGLENIRHHLELPKANISSRNLMEHALYGDLVTKMSPMV